MNFIHHTAVVPDSVTIGKNNYIGPYCVFGPNVHLGSNNRFESHVCVGLPAEKHGYFDKSGLVMIGDDNIVREHCTIQAGTTKITTIKNNCLMLRGSHLSHDSLLEDGVTVSCSVLIGGESYIMKGANLALGCILHQRSLIGSYSMVGMNSTTTKSLECLPGNIYIGSPAKLLKQNIVGLDRANISDLDLQNETKRFFELKRTRA